MTDGSTTSSSRSATELVLIHGSATDSGTFGLLVRALGDRFELRSFDRRGTNGEPVSVAEHAADALAQISGTAVAVGSSFGGVIALELARLAPDRIRAVVGLEPPAPAALLSPAIPEGMGCLFEAAAAAGDGESAAEVFARAVLGSATFERIPLMFRAGTLARWRAIRSDTRALADYNFARIAEIKVPVLILRGALSPDRFEHGAATLLRWLPNAHSQVVEGAGHMMHIEAAAKVARAIERFVSSLD